MPDPSTGSGNVLGGDEPAGLNPRGTVVVPVPVLALHGAADAIAPTEDAVARYRALVRQVVGA